MGKIKSHLHRVLDECYEMYASHGYGEVIDFVAEQQRVCNPDYMEVHDEYCKACDNDMPSLYNTCLVCGHPTEKHYFEIVHTGFSHDSEREEIEINAGEHGKIMIFQDDGKLGFIIDVYGENDHAATMTVWEEDLAPMSEDDDPMSEPNDPNNFSMVELADFKDEWGQYHDEICSELGYDGADASDALMEDYFWLPIEQKWYPICSSMYSEREQAIADYLNATK